MSEDDTFAELSSEIVSALRALAKRNNPLNNLWCYWSNKDKFGPIINNDTTVPLEFECFICNQKIIGHNIVAHGLFHLKERTLTIYL